MGGPDDVIGVWIGFQSHCEFACHTIVWTPLVTNGRYGVFKILNNGAGRDLKMRGGEPFKINFGATKDT